jgi:hypothetical protein
MELKERIELKEMKFCNQNTKQIITQLIKQVVLVKLVKLVILLMVKSRITESTVQDSIVLFQFPWIMVNFAMVGIVVVVINVINANDGIDVRLINSCFILRLASDLVDLNDLDLILVNQPFDLIDAMDPFVMVEIHFTEASIIVENIINIEDSDFDFPKLLVIMFIIIIFII